MKIDLVLFISLLFSATAALAESPSPTSNQTTPVQPAQVQPQSGAQPATTVAPRTEGRWIQTNEYGWVWIPKAAKQRKQLNADGRWVYTAQNGWLWMPGLRPSLTP